MSLGLLRKIWVGTALIVFVVTFNLFAVTQTWNATLELPVATLVEFDNPGVTPAALYGTFLTTIGLIALVTVGRWHARDPSVASHYSWSARFPLRVADIEPGTPAAKGFARSALILFIALPWYAIGHFARKVHTYGEVCYVADGAQERGISIWSRERKGAGFLNSDFRIGDSNTACTGVTFDPFWEPLMALALIGLALLLTSVFLLSLFRRRSAG